MCFLSTPVFPCFPQKKVFGFDHTRKFTNHGSKWTTATASFLPRERISIAAPGLYVDILSSLPPINSFKFLASTKAWFLFYIENIYRNVKRAFMEYIAISSLEINSNLPCKLNTTWSPSNNQKIQSWHVLLGWKIKQAEKYSAMINIYRFWSSVHVFVRLSFYFFFIFYLLWILPDLASETGSLTPCGLAMTR